MAIGYPTRRLAPRGGDLIFANRGEDESFGSAGDNQPWALARADVSGPGDTTGEALHGEDGDDVLSTRDGEVDKVDCGAGTTWRDSTSWT